MYLSRIELDTRRRNTMVKLLASPQVVHAVVENCFTRPAGVAKTRSLWRIDDLAGKKYLLVLSEEKPDFSHDGEYCREDAKESPALMINSCNQCRKVLLTHSNLCQPC